MFGSQKYAQIVHSFAPPVFENPNLINNKQQMMLVTPFTRKSGFVDAKGQ